MGSSVVTFRSDLPMVDMVRSVPDTPHRWIVWPAWQYRVCAPVVEQEELNLFQHAVLQLCQIGVRQSDRIAAALRLHPALVDVVVGELTRFDYLDGIRRPTTAGQEALVTGEVDPQDTQVAYVFQDVFTQTLWPGAEVNPRYADVAWDQGGPFLHSGSKGRPGPPRRLTAVALPARPVPQPPDALAILEAVRRRKPRRAGGGRPPRAIRRVSIVDAEPTLVWLSTCLYVGSHGEEETWQARDPFAGRPSPMLRGFVLARVDHDDGIRQVLGELTGGPAEKRAVNLYQSDLLVRRDVAARLELEFGLRATDDPELCGLLVAVETAYLRSGGGHGRAANEHTVTYAARTIELLLRRMVATYQPAGPVLAELGVNNSLRQQVVVDICHDLSLGSPGRLRALPWHQISRAFAGDHVNRNVLLAAAVLGVLRIDVDHPLTSFGPRRPGFADDWDRLGDLRNDGSHAAISNPSADEVEWSRDLAHEMVRAYLRSVSDPARETAG
ncbi:hypothetical protein GCM10027280_19640 [Micromonospora polyrhachis]|uniref:Uncharacterized protein n=1 Tax=Micromonospora polyrhachis TaxID=1282883 RepID=A0A7W7SLM0_9ACTN|nr:hypothetical protein [Micromonospora polyrhachis]MBB4957058.1 hypothetical protein [Micromonospora polyrhachis]